MEALSALPSCCGIPEYTIEYPAKGNPSQLILERYRQANGTIRATAFPSEDAYKAGAMCSDWDTPGWDESNAFCGPRAWCTPHLDHPTKRIPGAGTWEWGCVCHLNWRSLTGPSGQYGRYDQPWRFPAQASNTTSPREVCDSLNSSPLFAFMAAAWAINLAFFLGVLTLVLVTMVQLKRLSSNVSEHHNCILHKEMQ